MHHAQRRPFDKLVDSDVIRLRLQRKSTFDYRALIDFRKLFRDHDIQIVHAHSSALFVTRLVFLDLNRRLSGTRITAATLQKTAFARL